MNDYRDLDAVKGIVLGAAIGAWLFASIMFLVYLT